MSSFVLPSTNSPCLPSPSQRGTFFPPRQRLLTSTCPRSNYASTIPLNATAKIPSTLRDANIVIVGGGPCGLLTALMLAKRNVPVTVLERNHDYNRIDRPRSYCLGLSKRGRQAIRTIPGLEDHIAQSGLRYYGFRLHVKGVDGNVSMVGTPSGNESILLPRYALAQRLRSFVDRYDSVNVIQGVRIENVAFCDNGDVQLHVDGDVIRSKLVLACDGKNSFIGKSVTNADKNVNCANGTGTQSVLSESSDLTIKSVIMNSKVLDEWVQGADDEVGEKSVLILACETKGRKDHEQFQASGFQLNQHQRQLLGGHLVSIVRPSNNVLWRLKNVDEAYDVFQANFPQLPIRECISRKDMQEFIDAKPLQFGEVSRRKSLVATVGSAGGIVFLGDAAHSFPPDVGEGVNSAFQDALVFMNILDEAAETDGVQDILKRYEVSRDHDVEGLMKVVRFGNPHQFGHSKFGTFKTIVNFTLRRKLAQILPGIFNPPMVDLLGRGLGYGEIAQLADQTTTRLVVGSICLVLLPMFGISALHALL